MKRPSLAELSSLPDLPPGFALRACQPKEAGALAVLLRDSFDDDTWTADRARTALLDTPDVITTHVITHDGRMVATASSRLVPEQFPGSGYLHWVAADPGYRGRQLGRIVSLAALHEFVSLGCKDSVLETQDFRLPAIRTYLRLGFEPVYRDDTHIPRWQEIHRQLAGG